MNNQKGFTLVEMIIAIGILMLASGFILQLFLTAKTMNGRAAELDQSISLATSVVETLKASENLMEEDLKSILPESYRSMDKGVVSFKQALNEAFSPMPVTSSQMPTYQVTCQIKPGAQTGLADITVKIEKYDFNSKIASEGIPLKEIYSLSAAHYIGKQVGQ